MNPTEKEVFFLAVDKCLFSDGAKTKRCDFAVFDENECSLVEIKVVKPKNRGEERENMYKKLAETFDEFSRLEIDFEQRKLEAVLCFPTFDPIFEQSKVYPTFSARSGSEIGKFLQKYNAKLLEGNQKIFT